MLNAQDVWNLCPDQVFQRMHAVTGVYMRGAMQRESFDNLG
jgi:hypothetical protein